MTGCHGRAYRRVSSAAWGCRLDSNQRQRDYESRALPPELRHRASRALRGRPQRRRSYLAVCARALSLRFLVRRLASATRFLLFTSSPGCGGAKYGSVFGGQIVAEVGFEPTTFGLWARRAAPAPLRPKRKTPTLC